MDAIVFHIAGVISLLAAVMVVTRKNPVYSAIFLLLFFTTISLDFLILRAPFLAVIQVLVYAGAIMVLFIFVIMLLNLSPEELEERIPRGRKVFAFLASLSLFLLLVTAVRHSPTVQGAPELTGPVAGPYAALGEVEAIAHSLFGEHVLTFELVSILLLVAIIGAVYLTKRRLAPSRLRPEDEGGGPRELAGARAEAGAGAQDTTRERS
jgi:NADH-quinone oxidoreductase subunit J